VSTTEESIVATAAKKPVSKPVASSAKKPAAKVVAPVKSNTAPKTAAGKAAPVPANATPKAKPKPETVQASAPDKPKAVAPSKTSAPPPAPKPVVAAAPVSVPEKPLKTMKTAETKTPVTKPAAKASPAKPVKAGKKITGIPQNDAELMAMPESDYMNEAQLAYFKAKLTLMRDEILENARETGEHLKENEVFADPNDRATVEEENLLEQRVRDRERKLLKKINASLARIEEGEYGFCLETGDPIGIPRLLARPTAELSIEAQEKHERLEKLYAD
jgi:DnaK suppressor protein